MPTEKFKETDPEEIRHSRSIVELLRRVDQISAQLDKQINAPPDSKLGFDDSRTPHYPVSGYGHAQLLAAIGCLEALKHMILREDRRQNKISVEILAGPYGPYALVRNALDCAATALWLFEPGSSTLRIKRRIMLQTNEIKNAAALRESTKERGWEEWRDDNRKRMQEVVLEAGIATWDPLHKTSKLPTMTDTLTAVERYHRRTALPWLSSWQLASGHAHGKVWAQLASHQMDEIPDTRSEVGATFRISIRYATLAMLLSETVDLINVANARFLELLEPTQ